MTSCPCYTKKKEVFSPRIQMRVERAVLRELGSEETMGGCGGEGSRGQGGETSPLSSFCILLRTSSLT